MAEEITLDWLFDRLSSGVLPSYALLPGKERRKSLRLRLWESRELADQIIKTGLAGWNEADWGWDDDWDEDWEAPIAAPQEPRFGKDQSKGTDLLKDYWGPPEPIITEATIAVREDQLLRLLAHDNPPDSPTTPVGYLNTEDMLSLVVRRRYGPQWLQHARHRPDVETSDISVRREANDKFREALELVADAAVHRRLEFIAMSRGEQRSLPQVQQRPPFLETWIRTGRATIDGVAWAVITKKSAFDVWLEGLAHSHKPPEQAAAAAVTPTEMTPIYHTGLPGKPTAWHIVEPEVRRRYGDGERHPSNREWAHVLSNWLGSKHPQAPKMTEKTLGTKLAGLLRELRANEAQK